MATHTISTLSRLSAANLSQILLSEVSSNLDASTPPSKIAIIDVRDDDHIGGHIKHSIHAPSRTLDHKIPELVRKLHDKEAVVFHCALSQQRGPSAALRYIRERERLVGTGSVMLAPGSGVGEVLMKNKEEEIGREGKREGDKEKDKRPKKDEGNEEDKDAEWEEVEDTEGEKKQQKVYVLDRGFVGWQETFGEDTRLTEGYRKELWKDGYWM